MKKINLVGLTAGEIYELIKPEGYDLTHATTIANSIYKKRIKDFSGIPNVPGKLQLFLDNIAETIDYEPVAREVSRDGTVKYLFRNTEGQQYETVYIPGKKHDTICVSTQAGCRMGCPFCVTARYGYHGDLNSGDMIGQIFGIRPAAKVTHVVFMGMGEPLDNPESVMKTCGILTAEWGIGLSPGNITVSTIGITSSVIPFLERTGCNLTISLFSPFPEERMKVVPAERKFPVLEIIDILKGFQLKRKQRLSVAYVMISGFNDTDRHLEGLKRLLSGTGIRVNLLPYHRVKDDCHVPSSEERMMYFKHNLVVSGISSSIRKSRGEDISAACGLLASGIIRRQEAK